jgi:hypothetical protein
MSRSPADFFGTLLQSAAATRKPPNFSSLTSLSSTITASQPGPIPPVWHGHYSRFSGRLPWLAVGWTAPRAFPALTP